MPQLSRKPRKRAYRRRKVSDVGKVTKAILSATETKVVRGFFGAYGFPVTATTAGTIVPTGAANTGVVGVEYMNCPIDGYASDQRVSWGVTEQGLHIKGHLHSSVINTGDVCRIIVVRDNQNRGAAPAGGLGDILEVITGSGNDWEVTPRNWLNRKRFTFLRDVTIPVNPPVVGLDIHVPFEFRIKLRKKLTFLQGTSYWPSLGQGPIFMYLIGARPFANITCVGTWEFFYKDH